MSTEILAMAVIFTPAVAMICGCVIEVWRERTNGNDA